MEHTVLYYFSGTGSTLHVAKELQRRMPGSTVIPMVSRLDRHSVPAEGGVVGFIFPVYLMSLPQPVRSFIELIDLQSTEYRFAVMTHCGYPGKVAYHLQKILKSRESRLDAYFLVKMVANSPTGLMPSWMFNQRWGEQIGRGRLASLEKDLIPQFDSISQAVKKKAMTPGPVKQWNLVDRALQALLMRMAKNRKTAIRFFTDSSCDGCGTCHEVCPSGKVTLEQGKPVWRRDTQCYYCYACFNFCPNQAILVKKYHHKNGRYSFPGISAADIAAQKRQQDQ